MTAYERAVYTNITITGKEKEKMSLVAYGGIPRTQKIKEFIYTRKIEHTKENK